MMKFYDLFCGIGGFRVGMEKNGHECVGSCEIDEYARQIYTRNFGHEPEQRDVRELDPKDIPDFDCLCAGFPCQAFSLAGKRRGFEDTRGTLFFEIARIVQAKRPKAIVLENVKQLATLQQGAVIRRITDDLTDLDYTVDYRIFNALNFGLPQKRERTIIVATLAEFDEFPWPTKVVPMKSLEEILEPRPNPYFHNF